MTKIKEVESIENLSSIDTLLTPFDGLFNRSFFRLYFNPQVLIIAFKFKENIEMTCPLNESKVLNPLKE